MEIIDKATRNHIIEYSKRILEAQSVSLEKDIYIMKAIAYIKRGYQCYVVSSWYDEYYGRAVGKFERILYDDTNKCICVDFEFLFDDIDVFNEILEYRYKQDNVKIFINNYKEK